MMRPGSFVGTIGAGLELPINQPTRKLLLAVAASQRETDAKRELERE